MTDAVDTKHPTYIERADEWSLMRDTTAGEKEVKGAGTQYLPQPSGWLPSLQLRSAMKSMVLRPCGI
ncbi:hypothetical protein ABID21_005018 [Pseudorhizobium tarimense]|uniref:Uncharacterized protein n=1 Tax=Pseudorhizobium tarimense TaxID=1079109 RepID=A0ABV2HEB0_9HYPH|nr:hypothetical protein [Pseudorhizobium tarimense]MCJ8521842.1 hypothetical protein [Pseudorhizobium tarimense]